MKQLLIVILVCLFAFFVYVGEKETSYERVVRTGTIRCGYIGWKPYFESWMSKFKKKNDEIAINVFTLALA